jgi:hypothetical protein
MGRGKGKAGRASWVRRGVLVAAAAGALSLTGEVSFSRPAEEAHAEHGEIDSAWYQGRLVRFELAPLEGGEEPFLMGPWRFGARVATKPHDRRLNLYLAAPGTQHRTPGWEAYDHNDVINALPPEGALREWDVYWAVVLDPALQPELRSERDLLLEAQAGFRPEEGFSLEQAPGHAFLKRFVGVRSMRELERYRRRDGTLPRLIIAPAGFAIRGRAFAPPPPERAEAGAPRGE